MVTKPTIETVTVTEHVDPKIETITVSQQKPTVTEVTTVETTYTEPSIS